MPHKLENELQFMQETLTTDGYPKSFINTSNTKLRQCGKPIFGIEM